jgi:predicted Zn finger-like uncharacterized protein
MRLICPNCDAQYEVRDDVIPTEGRDVQCSNCGQTWYQHHPNHMPPEPEPTDLSEDYTQADDAHTPEAKSVKEPEPQRRKLDPSVADILQQEAELESQVRAREATSLESQPDLGLDSTQTKASRQASDRMARIRGEDPSTEAEAPPDATGSRRDLLPDIEEINSTLRSASDRQSAIPTDPNQGQALQVGQKSGFRRGFALVFVLAVALGAVYSFAPQIAKSMPQADPYISVYVARVDSARQWLDGHVQIALNWLDTVASTKAQ